MLCVLQTNAFAQTNSLADIYNYTHYYPFYRNKMYLPGKIEGNIPAGTTFKTNATYAFDIGFKADFSFKRNYHWGLGIGFSVGTESFAHRFNAEEWVVLKNYPQFHNRVGNEQTGEKNDFFFNPVEFGIDIIRRDQVFKHIIWTNKISILARWMQPSLFSETWGIFTGPTIYGFRIESNINYPIPIIKLSTGLNYVLRNKDMLGFQLGWNQAIIPDVSGYWVILPGTEDESRGLYKFNESYLFLELNYIFTRHWKSRKERREQRQNQDGRYIYNPRF